MNAEDKLVYDFNESKILEMEKAKKEALAKVEELIVFAFESQSLRNIWRKKFGLPTKEENENEQI